MLMLFQPSLSLHAVALSDDQEYFKNENSSPVRQEVVSISIKNNL